MEKKECPVVFLLMKLKHSLKRFPLRDCMPSLIIVWTEHRRRGLFLIFLNILTAFWFLSHVSSIRVWKTYVCFVLGFNMIRVRKNDDRWAPPDLSHATLGCPCMSQTEILNKYILNVVLTWISFYKTSVWQIQSC